MKALYVRMTSYPLVEFTGKSMSYRDIPVEDLRSSLRLVELAEKRAEKHEKLQRLLSKGAVFEITRTSKSNMSTYNHRLYNAL